MTFSKHVWVDTVHGLIMDATTKKEQVLELAYKNFYSPGTMQACKDLIESLHRLLSYVIENYSMSRSILEKYPPLNDMFRERIDEYKVFTLGDVLKESCSNLQTSALDVERILWSKNTSSEEIASAAKRVQRVQRV